MTHPSPKFVKALRRYARSVGIVELDQASAPYLVEVPSLEEPWRTWRYVWMGNARTVAVLHG